MSYMPRPQAPRVSRAQAERLDRWWEWKREQERIIRAAMERFKAGDTEGFLALDAQAKALVEPDQFGTELAREGRV